MTEIKKSGLDKLSNLLKSVKPDDLKTGKVVVMAPPKISKEITNAAKNK